MTIYTVIDYRESYYDSRHQDSSESEFEYRIFDEREQAINYIYELLIRKESQKDSYAYSDWDFRLLIDGMDDDWWRMEFWDEGLGDYNCPMDFLNIQNEAYAKRNEWRNKAKEREEEAKAEAKAQKKRAEEASARAAIATEKKLLAKLKEKYPDA